MNDYVIITDSACDLPAEMVNELGIHVIPLSVIVNGQSYKIYPDERALKTVDYYNMLREGVLGKTSAANVFDFEEAMEPYLREGRDVLYLAFSSALSGTYNASVIAAEELSEKYPDRKILTADTLCASMGQGLLVYLAAKKKAEGASIDEVYEYVENNKLHLCHWFTVDDLNHLKRGGRVSAVAATFGTILNIKPVLHVDNEGKLIPVEKVRGRKASISGLIKEMERRIIDNSIAFISHGDCEEEAMALAAAVKERFDIKEVRVNYIGAVIGTHSGPGTVALFFLGRER